MVATMRNQLSSCPIHRLRYAVVLFSVTIVCTATTARCGAKTVALWLFDEQAGLYPSCVLGDAATNDFPLVLGRGGEIVPGKFGNALRATEQPKLDLSSAARFTGFENKSKLNLTRKTPPMDWSNADFCALMTRGEKHLRQEVGFGSPTRSELNLGAADWTVEFWYQPGAASDADGVVLELGPGPRGEDDRVTQLVLNRASGSFTLVNQPSATSLKIPSSPQALRDDSKSWSHLAFVYDAKNHQLRHFVNGRLQPLPVRCELQPLSPGDEDYLSIGRDGAWQRPLPGSIDEFRVSNEQVYTSDFTPPESFSKYNRAEYHPPKLTAGPPLLFADDKKTRGNNIVDLGGRKYLFIDDALLAESEHLEFTVNPPRFAERVLDDVQGHLVVWQDEEGLIRMYYNAGGKQLGVLTSRDGVHWDKPKLNPTGRDASNIVINDPVGLGTLFVDSNAPPEERIKYLSGYDGRGIYVYTSPDGYHFRRNETAALPFRAASQSTAYYDDQRQKYVAFHRSDMAETVGGHTERSFVMTETADPLRPWPFRPISLAEHLEVAKQRRIGNLLPWYLDNGPLTPPGFGIEYPTVFGPTDGFDPIATDVYVPKNVKYAWAPDTYLAFPIVYFHYHDDGPAARQELGKREQQRGSGTLETQLAVSRDGIHWQRYPRPAYIKIGRHAGLDIHKNYIAHGLVHRGDEIWQYYLGSEQYHSDWGKGGREAVFRVVQRFDGFVSADTPYSGGRLVTRPLKFTGNRLVLNIDTGAAGYAQVGLLDEAGKSIPGFNTDQCIYINGDFMNTEVEWLNHGGDVSSLSGKTVRLEIVSRGTKLYSLQFVTR